MRILSQSQPGGAARSSCALLTAAPPAALPTATPEEKQTDTRTPRAIRFSDSEWDEVKTAAAEHEIPAAEFVRDAVLDLARNKTAADPAVMPPGIVALIERIYRSTYIVATLKRDEMLREGRRAELDEMIKLARETQATIQEDASK